MAIGHNGQEPSAGTGGGHNLPPFGLLLTNPLIIQGATALTAGLVLLIASERQGPIFRWTIALALVIYALTQFLNWFRTSADKRNTVRTFVAMGASLFLAVVFAVQWMLGAVLVELAIVAVLVVTGFSNIADSVRLYRRNEATEVWSWSLVKGVLLIIFGAIVGLWPADMIFAAVGITGFFWALSGVIAITYALRGRMDEFESKNSSELIMAWLQKREFSSEERRDLIRKVSYEGPDLRKRLVRFSALMTFSVMIATLGVIQDSTAVVIGAMLVAPLMTPIMGLASAIVMGWPKRAMRSGLLVLAATGGAILVATIVTGIAPIVGDVLTSSQVVSRTSPTLLDLMIALTAGAAGAFALSRQDVSDSLPGVAIAVALVPPLAVVGVALAAGDMSQALGAFLLYLTNFVSIVLAGAATFILVGATPFYSLKQHAAGIRVALGTFVIGASLIIVPLAFTTQSLANSAAIEAATDQAISEWMGDDRDYSVPKIKFSNDTINVVMSVSGGLPSVDELGKMLEEDIEEPFTLRISWTPETVVEYKSE